jgi:excisionase family DNA binding protein
VSANTLEHTPTVDRLLGIGVVADRLGYSQSTVRKLVTDGRLPVVRLVPGGRLKFRERDVQALVDASQTKGDAS